MLHEARITFGSVCCFFSLIRYYCDLSEKTDFSKMRLNYRLAFLSVLPFGILIFMGNAPETNGKAQFVQPLNWGMNMCVPYDLANIFNRPIAAVTGVALAGFLAAVLFFGVITAPFGYMFGIPSRKYVLGGDSNLFPPAAAGSRSFQESSLSDYLIEEYGNYSENVMVMEEEYPFKENNYVPVEFLDNAFYLLPKVKDEQCKQFVICMAHGTFPYFPRKLVQIYKLFSRKLTDIPDAYRKAMLLGLTDKSLCHEEYNCATSALTMIVQTLTGFLPEWTRRKAPYNTFT